MLTEQKEKDIRDLYRDGFSRAEILEKYEGVIDKKRINDICDEEDGLWDTK